MQKEIGEYYYTKVRTQTDAKSEAKPKPKA
jgi:hypothetical protein